MTSWWVGLLGQRGCVERGLGDAPRSGVALTTKCHISAQLYGLQGQWVCGLKAREWGSRLGGASSESVPMPTIALVDDDCNILTSVSMALEAEGYRIITYGDG